MEFLDYTVVLFFIFLGPSIVFHSGSTILQSTNSVQEFQFLHILTKICYFVSWEYPILTI